MHRNEKILQIIFLLLTASLLALFSARLYPKKLILSSKRANAQILARPIPEPSSTPTFNQKLPPTSINIPSISLSLSISPGVVENNEWTLFEDRVSWLSTSSVAGKGNVILYAHNRDHLFGKLKLLGVGSVIIIDQGGKPYSYKVVEKRKVNPTEVDSVLSKGNQLTLYTCDGTFDQKRLIVIAMPHI